MKPQVCVLVSGGLDSAVLLSELARRHRVFPVYIRQGLAWEKAELYWLRRFMAHCAHSFYLLESSNVRVLSLPMGDLYGPHWSTSGRAVPGRRSPDSAVYLPGRNLALSVKAAIFCAREKIPALAIGSLDHNPFPDASPRFFKTWSRALGRGLGVKLSILAPYRKLTKAQVIRRGKHLPLHLTFSCIAPKGRMHCGRCNKCAERKKAFRAAGVEDRTRYAH